MTTKIMLNDCVPCIAIHPGEILKDELDAREMKQKDLAMLIDMPTSALNDIIKGRRPITPEIAILLQQVFDIESSYWLSLQNQYDLDIAQISERTIERKRNIEIWQVVSQYCAVKSLEKLGVLGIKVSENIKKIYQIFGINSIEELITSFSCEKEVSYFKKSERLVNDPVNLFTWKHYAYYMSSQIPDLVKFDKSNLAQLVEKLNVVFLENENTIEKTKIILSQYGIKFIVLRKFDKTPIDGFSFWNGANPTIVLTLRIGRIDNYAFALLHEIFHVYNHLYLNSTEKYISIEGERIDECEEEANKFAKEALISKEVWSDFMHQHSMISPYAMQQKIKDFAHSHKVNEAIVLGFYQHDVNLYSMKSSIIREIR